LKRIGEDYRDDKEGIRKDFTSARCDDIKSAASLRGAIDRAMHLVLLPTGQGGSVLKAPWVVSSEMTSKYNRT